MKCYGVFTLDIILTAGCDNSVVYAASDVPKRMSLTPAAGTTCNGQALYAGKVGRGYRRNPAWVAIPPCFPT